MEEIKKRKTYKMTLIFSILIAVVALIGSFIINFVLAQFTKKKYQNKGYLTLDNSNSWMNIPGEIKNTITHSFKAFNLEIANEDKTKTLEYDFSKIKVDYNNLDFLSFDEISQFIPTSFMDKSKKVEVIKKTKLTNKKENKILVKNFSFEFLKTLMNLSNLPLHRVSINGFKLALNKIFINQLFDKLFTGYFIKNISTNTNMLKQWLKSSISEKSIDLILNKENKYSWVTPRGFFYWVPLINNPDLIETEKYKWIESEISIVPEQAKKLVDSKSFLASLNKYFEFQLNKNINCTDKSQKFERCSDEKIIISQITTSKPIEMLEIEGVTTINSLNEYIFKDEVEKIFSEDPELKSFFAKYSSVKEVTNYDKVSLSEKQANDIFSYDSSISLLKPEISLGFLKDFIKKDIYSAYTRIGLRSYEQMIFLGEYFFKFIPNKFYLVSFDEKIDPLSNSLLKGYSRMLINSVVISQEAIRLNIRYISLTKSLFQLSINNKFTCDSVLKPYIPDEKDLNKACSVLNFNTYENTKSWVKPYECNYISCKSKEKEIFSKNTGISEEIIDKIYNDKDSILKKSLDEIETSMINKYKCNVICTDTLLSKIQFLESYVTLNPIDIIKDIKSSTLKDWDKDEMNNNEYELNLKDGQYDNFIDLGSENNYLKVYKDILTFYSNIPEKKYKYFTSEKQIKDLKEHFNKIFELNIIESSYDMSKFLFGQNLNENSYIYKGETNEGYYSSKNNKLEGILSQSSDNEIEYEDSFTFSTGHIDLDKFGIRKINNVNKFNFFNTKSNEIMSDDSYELNTIPLYFNLDSNVTKSQNDELNNNDDKEKLMFKNTINTNQQLNGYINDGYQFSFDYFEKKEYMYYYDFISKRTIPFIYSFFSTTKNGIPCARFDMVTEKLKFKNLDRQQDLYNTDTNNFSNGFFEYNLFKQQNQISDQISTFYSLSKLPIVLSSAENVLNNKEINTIKNKSEFEKEIVKENYICVDVNTFDVVESNFNIVYLVNTKLLNHFTKSNKTQKRINISNKIIENLQEDSFEATFVPLFVYSRQNTVDYNSYISKYSFISSYYKLNLASQIVFFTIFGVFTVIGCYMIYKLIKKD